MSRLIFQTDFLEGFTFPPEAPCGILLADLNGHVIFVNKIAEKILGVPIVINYMPGAGGGLAWTKFAQAKPDGYTVCGINIPHIILQPLSQKDVAFQTEDPKPLCIFESTPIGLPVKKDSKINSVKEFIEFAKANPNKITVGMSGKFSGHHMPRSFS